MTPAKLQQLMDVASAAVQEKEQSWSATVNRMKLIQLMTPKRVMLLLEALRDAERSLSNIEAVLSLFPDVEKHGATKDALYEASTAIAALDVKFEGVKI